MDSHEQLIKEIEKLRHRLLAVNKTNNRYENAAANDHLCSAVWWLETYIKNTGKGE